MNIFAHFIQYLKLEKQAAFVFIVSIFNLFSQGGPKCVNKALNIHLFFRPTVTTDGYELKVSASVVIIQLRCIALLLDPSSLSGVVYIFKFKSILFLIAI